MLSPVLVESAKSRLEVRLGCSSFFWHNDERVHHYQQGRASIMGLGLWSRKGIENERLVAVGQAHQLSLGLGFLLYLSRDAEFWMPSVMPEYYHEYGIIINIIQKMVWKPLHIRAPQPTRIVVVAPWVPLNRGNNRLKLQPE